MTRRHCASGSGADLAGGADAGGVDEQIERWAMSRAAGHGAPVQAGGVADVEPRDGRRPRRGRRNRRGPLQGRLRLGQIDEGEPPAVGGEQPSASAAPRPLAAPVITAVRGTGAGARAGRAGAAKADRDRCGGDEREARKRG